jgi:predicted outer membrane repeat protein
LDHREGVRELERCFHHAAARAHGTFSGNSAFNPPFSVGALGGGGIYNGAKLSVTGSTFSDNSALNGGGIFGDGTLARWPGRDGNGYGFPQPDALFEVNDGTLIVSASGSG